MTRYERAEAELVREQGFDIMVGDTAVPVNMSTENAALLLRVFKEQGWNVGIEPVNPEFLGWTLEEIAEHIEA